MAFKGYSEKEMLIQVRVDLQKASTQLNKLSADLKGTGDSSKKTNAPLKGMAGNIDLITKAAGGYLSLRFAKQLILEADAYNVLQTRIRTATKETGNYEKVSRELYNTSQRNGVALETTVGLFQNLARSAPELGATTDQTLALTNAVQQLGVISGASTTNLSAGLLQFSQGLAAGVFRAEEFNSILENIPEVGNRIAKGMGLTVGQLRAAVLDGKVLSKDVFDSLVKQADEINAEFLDLPDAVQRAGVALSNSFTRFLSQLDQAATGTSTLALVMRKITESLDNWSERLGEGELDELMRQRAAAAVRYSALIENGTSKESRAVQEVLRLITELDDKIKAANLSLLAGEKDKPKTPPKKTTPPQSQDDKAQQARIDRTIKNLQLEAQAFGATEREATLLKLQLEGASAAQLTLADTALQSIEANQEFQASVEASEKAVQDENETYQKWLDTLREDGAKVYEDTRTEAEQLAEKLQRLDLLLSVGAITFDTYARAVFDAEGAMNDIKETGTTALDELTAATKGWGDQFTNTLADMVQHGKADFHELSQSIINDLLRILIYQNVTKPILGELGVTGFAEGGYVSGPGSATSDSIPARLSNGEYVQPARAVAYYGAGFMEQVRRMQLPKYADGGLVSIHRPPVAHFADGGLVDGQGLPGGGEVTVNVENKGQPVAVKDARARFDARGLVVNVVLDDLGSDGPIARKMSQSFGITRRPS